MRRLKEITHEAESLPTEQQTEVLDFIAFLKAKQQLAKQKELLKTPQDIERFFRGFNIDVTGYRFNRDEANER